jgi:DNA-binding transcriptional ArsR family regulator
MNAEPTIATTAQLIGEPARAIILGALLAGEALPATELAQRCRLTPQTVSAHLAKLMDGGLIAVHRVGRHRYYRLAGPQVARALEALQVIAPQRPVRSLKESDMAHILRNARTCYDHLAGRLGVALTDHLLARGWLTATEHDFALTDAGEHEMAALGVDLDAARARRRAFAPQCIDWSERRPHLAGSLGAALTARLFANGWVERVTNSRGVRLTAVGKEQLERALGLSLSL